MIIYKRFLEYTETTNKCHLLRSQCLWKLKKENLFDLCNSRFHLSWYKSGGNKRKGMEWIFLFPVQFQKEIEKLMTQENEKGLNIRNFYLAFKKGFPDGKLSMWGLMI